MTPLPVEAALHGDTEHVVHAVALDPLTSAVCTLKEIREMCSEMLEAQRQWLPKFAGKRIASRPTSSSRRAASPPRSPSTRPWRSTSTSASSSSRRRSRSEHHGNIHALRPPRTATSTCPTAATNGGSGCRPRDHYTDNFRQRSMGLMLDNAREIRQVFTAVFPSARVLDRLLQAGTHDCLLVLHHAMHWDIRNNPPSSPSMSRIWPLCGTTASASTSCTPRSTAAAPTPPPIPSLPPSRSTRPPTSSSTSAGPAA